MVLDVVYLKAGRMNHTVPVVLRGCLEGNTSNAESNLPVLGDRNAYPKVKVGHRVMNNEECSRFPAV